MVDEQVVCSDCGHKFNVTEDVGVFTPASCPECGEEIDHLEVPPDGSRTVAFVRER